MDDYKVDCHYKVVNSYGQPMGYFPNSTVAAIFVDALKGRYPSSARIVRINEMSDSDLIDSLLAKVKDDDEYLPF